MQTLTLCLVLAAASPSEGPRALSYDPLLDGVITGVVVGGWAVSELGLKHTLAPKACRWCETNGFDVAVRRVFNPSEAPSAFGIPGPDLWSNLVGFGFLPAGVVASEVLLSLGSGGTMKDLGLDAWFILEATFLAQALNQSVKFLAGRGRPYTVGAPAELLAQGRDPADHFMSFYSGHATFAFGLAASAGMVATLRGYKHAWVAWAVGMPLATATAVLRLAADKHWTSDILLGAALGTAIGAGLPWLLHRPKSDAARVQVAVGPAGVLVHGVF